MAMLRSFIGKFAVSLLCLFLLAGCTQKIDGSSKEAYDASLKKITEKMSEEESTQFRKAIGFIGIKSLKLHELFRKHPPGTPMDKQAFVPGAALREMVDGKTVAEVLKMGEEARIEQEARREASLKERAARGLPLPSPPGPRPGMGVLKAPPGPGLPQAGAGAAPAAAAPTAPPVPQS